MSLQSFLPVDCSVLLFAPWFHLHMLLTVSLSLTFLLWYPTPDYHCSVVGPVSTVCDGSWICCSCCCYLILPTFICLCSPYFFHLLSCVLVVAVCHVIFLHFCHPSALTLLIVVSFLLATNEQSLVPFPLYSSSSSSSMQYTLSLRVPPSPLGSIASSYLTIIEQAW